MPPIKHSFICQVCMEPVPFMQGRYEKRIEYYRSDGKKRLRSLTIGYLCRTHAEEDAVYEDQKRKGTVSAEQWKQEPLPID